MACRCRVWALIARRSMHAQPSPKLLHHENVCAWWMAFLLRVMCVNSYVYTYRWVPHVPRVFHTESSAGSGCDSTNATDQYGAIWSRDEFDLENWEFRAHTNTASLIAFRKSGTDSSFNAGGVHLQTEIRMFATRSHAGAHSDAIQMHSGDSRPNASDEMIINETIHASQESKFLIRIFGESLRCSRTNRSSCIIHPQSHSHTSYAYRILFIVNSAPPFHHMRCAQNAMQQMQMLCVLCRHTIPSLDVYCWLGIRIHARQFQTKRATLARPHKCMPPTFEWHAALE